MTRDEILNMPAGDAMNELIAEKLDIARKVFQAKPGDMFWKYMEGYVGIQPLYIGQYSTDLSAAWEVMEWIKNNALEVAVGHTADDKLWDCCIWFFQDKGNNHAIRGYAETAPLAICRAALLAVMGIEQ